MYRNSQEDVPCKLFDPSDMIPDFQIDDAMRNELCFREDLIVSSKDVLTSEGKAVGGYSISTESIGSQKEEFMTQVLSSFSVNDALAGSKLTSSTTAKLHCLDEKRTEFIRRADGVHEKLLFLGLEDDVYHLRTEDLCPCDKSRVFKKDLPLPCHRDLISEGANLLLMRYLALKNFHGNLSFQSITIEGRLTTCNYRCSEAQHMEFNNRTIEVYTIERRMHEECGLVRNTKTHMTTKGRILKHDWLEVPYFLQINPLLDPNCVDDTVPKIQAPLRSRWSGDIQMLSDYLSQKTCRMAQQKEYLTNHPEIKQLISDYAQTLLAVKPMNVLSFTIQHFAAFAKNPERASESNLDVTLELTGRKPGEICGVCDICSNCVGSEQQMLEDGDRGALKSTCRTDSPQFSSCSVFSKCPSNSTCIRKFSGDSTCDFYPECKNTCAGCQLCKGKKLSACNLSSNCDKICDGCKFGKGQKFSACNLSSSCKQTCDGCKFATGMKLSACNLSSSCKQTCDGCKFAKAMKLSACSLSSSCGQTCDGCKFAKREKLSACNLSSSCRETCDGCKFATGQKLSACNLSASCKQTCDGCKFATGEKLSDCNLSASCKQTCDGCKFSKGQKLSACSLSSSCRQTCAGCKFGTGLKPSACSLSSKCGQTCDGCISRKGQKLSACSLSSTCKQTCDGCKLGTGKKFSACSLSSNCARTCDGCRTSLEPCTERKACPECPGCRLVCSEIKDCPNCEKCNMEIPADI